MKTLRESLINKSNIRNAFKLENYFVIIPGLKDFNFLNFTHRYMFQMFKYSYRLIDIWIIPVTEISNRFNCNPIDLKTKFSDDDTVILMTDKKINDIVKDFKKRDFYYFNENLEKIAKENNYKILK